MNHMPRVHDFLHYRIFDVTSVELVIEGLLSKKHEEAKEASNGKRVNEELW
jgi:oligoribonuclease (3'-5' exoribonuclease)